MADKVRRFWETKTLQEMSSDEWEVLCDGCGLCCLQKLEDDEGEGIFYTRIACKLLDLKTCRCKQYAERRKTVPDCIQLTADDVDNFDWLPPTCAYRCLASGEPLPVWHPLITGDPDTTIKSGITMSGKMLSETEVQEDDWENYLIFRVG